MAIDLRDEVNDYLADPEALPRWPCVCGLCKETRCTTVISHKELMDLLYKRALLAGFVNWLADNERLGILRR